MAFIVSIFLFLFSVPQTCFAELGSVLAKDKNIEISCSVSKAVNLLDISNKIVKKYYGDTKEFFFSGGMLNGGDKKTPEYTYKSDEIAVNKNEIITVNNSKKDNLYSCHFSNFSGLVNNRMRGSPPGCIEITKLYLLSIEALQKGSVPASSIIAGNILL